MSSLNTNLKELSKDIRLKRRDIRKRCDSLTKFIRNKSFHKFEDQTIGSYAIKTTIKQKDKEYDIDMALIFHNISNEKVKNQKQAVYSFLKEYKDNINDDPKVKYKEYAITLDFVSSESNNKYHFDYTIYNKDHYVVKGEQHSEKELENSGNIEFVDEIKKDLADDSKEHFFVVTRLLKHCVKNGKFKSTLNIPSIVLTNSTKIFIDGWDGNDNFIESLINVFLDIRESIDDYKLSFEPFDNPFERFSDQQINDNKNKLDEVIKILNEANEETDEIEKWELIKELFPQLKKPKRGSGDGEKSSTKRTTSSQGA